MRPISDTVTQCTAFDVQTDCVDGAFKPFIYSTYVSSVSLKLQLTAVACRKAIRRILRLVFCRVCDFLLVTNSNHSPMLPRFRDIAGFPRRATPPQFHLNFRGVSLGIDC